MKEAFNPSSAFGELAPSHRHPEDAVTLANAKALYLAGLLEAGAGFSVNVKTGKKKNGHELLFVQSTLYFHDTDVAVVNSIAGLFGGKSSPMKGEKTQRWCVYEAQEIRRLLDSIYPYAPSRQWEIEMFRDILNAQGTEKHDLVDKLNDYRKNKKKFPDKEVYESLVMEPAFLAGAYDARGHPFVSKNPLSTFDCVYFGSLNTSLIDGITEAHGGSDRDFRNSDDSKTQKRLVIGRSAGHKVLHFIGPYRAVPLYNAQKRIVSSHAA